MVYASRDEVYDLDVDDFTDHQPRTTSNSDVPLLTSHHPIRTTLEPRQSTATNYHAYASGA